MTKYFIRFILIGVVFILSCASKNKPEESSLEGLAEQIPPHLRAKSSGADKFSPVPLPGEKAPAGLPASEAASVRSLGGLPALPSADDLIWTDPDNPDQNLGQIEEAFAKPVKGPWRVSYREARREAYARERPLLIWFTNSRSSPTCQTLSRELFSKLSFGKWAEQHVVRLRIDSAIQERDAKRLGAKRRYLDALKKRFHVKGHPTVLVVGPDGKVIGRYKGYRMGEGEYYWGRLKNAVKTIDEGFYDWVLARKEQGYRTWTGRNGVELFAKLKRYQNGRLLVVEPEGNKTIINEQNLSKADRGWLASEKEKRGL